MLEEYELGCVEEGPLGDESGGEHVVLGLGRPEAVSLVVVEVGKAAADGGAVVPRHEVVSWMRVA